MVEDGERMCVQFDENTDEIVVHFFTVYLQEKHALHYRTSFSKPTILRDLRRLPVPPY